MTPQQHLMPQNLAQLQNQIHEKFAAANRKPNATVIGNWLSLNGITTHTGEAESFKSFFDG